MSYCLSIGLFGKGSTNHLHRKEVVRSFNKRGIEVTFVVREDYLPLLEKLEGCKYISISFSPPSGWRSIFLKLCEITRKLYPSRDIERIAFFKVFYDDLRDVRNRFIYKICQLFARYRWSVRLLPGIERLAFQPELVEGIDPKSIDQFLPI